MGGNSFCSTEATAGELSTSASATWRNWASFQNPHLAARLGLQKWENDGHERYAKGFAKGLDIAFAMQRVKQALLLESALASYSCSSCIKEYMLYLGLSEERSTSGQLLQLSDMSTARDPAAARKCKLEEQNWRFLSCSSWASLPMAELPEYIYDWVVRFHPFSMSQCGRAQKVRKRRKRSWKGA